MLRFVNKISLIIKIDKKMERYAKDKGTHESNRSKMCLFCQNKPKTALPISGVIKIRIENLFSEYSASDLRLPKVICNACRQKLFYPYNNTCASQIAFPDYSSYQQVDTTEDQDCECSLCNIVRSRFGTNLIGVPKKSAKIAPNKENKLCLKCLNKIGRGIHHKCGVKTLVSNLEGVMKDGEWNEKAKEQVTAKFVKMLVPNQSSGNCQRLSLSQVNCKPLDIIVRPEKDEKSKKAVVSVKAMRDMQVALNLSDNQTRTATKILIKSTGNKKIVEKNIVKKMSNFTHATDDFFEFCSFEFTNEINNKIAKFERQAVVCKNLRKFIDFVIQRRNTYDYHLKFGVDGEGKFLKFCLSIQSTVIGDVLSNACKKTRSSFRDSGVKKLFIIAIAQNVQEN